MSYEIRIPRLGWSMEEGTFVQWLKKPGENVRVGEPLFEFEGDKATQTVEAVDAGILAIAPDAPAGGDVVAVGTLLGYLLADGESIPVGPPVQEPAPASESHWQPHDRPAEPSFVDHPIASPRAKRVARETGVDWTSLQGTGQSGRIREADVRAESTRRQQEIDGGASRNVSPSSRRRAIAGRLRMSQERTVPVTLTTRIDATNLVRLRERFRTEGALTPPAYTDIVACVVARVLARHPHVAAHRQNDDTSTKQTPSEGFDIGIAVHTEDGLLVPVLRAVGTRSLPDVAAQSQTLIARAREGTISAAEMQGGVFTISSLGAYGIDAFTPVINYPEIAILGLGAIRREPVVLPDGQIGPSDCMVLSLTFDHAELDGVPAAAFLRDVATELAERVDECLATS